MNTRTHTRHCAVNVKGAKDCLLVIPILCLKYMYWSSEMWNRFDGWRVFHRLSFLLAHLAETGDFLNCEGSGLFLLQSSCENNAERFGNFFFCLVILHKHCYCKHKDIERSLPVMCFIVKVTTAAYRTQRRLSPTTTSCFTWAPWVTSALARSELGWLNMGYTPPKVVWRSFTKALVVRMRLSDKTQEAYFSVCCARCNAEWIFFLQISYFCAHKFSMKLGLNCVKNIVLLKAHITVAPFSEWMSVKDDSSAFWITDFIY